MANATKKDLKKMEGKMKKADKKQDAKEMKKMPMKKGKGKKGC